jgi:outer membrane protein W
MNMFRTKVFSAALLVTVVAAAPAMAQQTISLNVGWFTVRDIGDRVYGDAITANLLAEPPYALSYQVSDFNNVTFGGDYLFPIGRFLEGGVGVTYYRKTVHSFYADLTDTNGSDIRQDLRLRTVPVTASIRFLPVGRHYPVEPYIGFGVSVTPWSYTEYGDFVDTSQNIYSARYHDSGVAVGPTVMGGVRVKVAPQFLVGGEIRYTALDARLDPTVQFLGSRIDLGGVSYLATVNFRF